MTVKSRNYNNTYEFEMYELITGIVIMIDESLQQIEFTNSLIKIRKVKNQF